MRKIRPSDGPTTTVSTRTSSLFRLFVNVRALKFLIRCYIWFCLGSSSITIRDEKSGADYTVGSQNINNSVNSNSGGLNLEVGRIFYVLLAIIVGFTASEF